MTYKLFETPGIISAPRGARLAGFFTGLLSVMVVVLAAVAAWLVTATHVIDLNRASSSISMQLLETWSRGEAVVLIRHAERCDRSGAACLGPADGITVDGSRAASVVGIGLNQLGLDKARILASPLTRTRQTAAFIAGREVETQSWLEDCDRDFHDKALGLKRAHENLVLITHSGCIDHFERQMGLAAGSRSSSYAQAFFIQVNGSGEARIMGALSAGDWKNFINEQWN